MYIQTHPDIVTTSYAAEVMPVPLRCYLTTYVNLCWVFGQLIATGVLRGLLSSQTSWGYRIPFALQWMWPIPLIVGCLMAPESPWWCVRRGKISQAKHNLKRLTSLGRNPDFNVDHTIDMMIHTNEVEKEISSGTHYWDCFKRVDLRRTEITCFVWAIQNLCGSSFMVRVCLAGAPRSLFHCVKAHRLWQNFSTYFYKQAGLSDEYSFDMSIVQYALGACGTVGSWFLMARAGRRTLYVYGLIGLVILLLIIGILGTVHTSSSVSWAIGSMLLVYTFICEFSWQGITSESLLEDTYHAITLLYLRRFDRRPGLLLARGRDLIHAPAPQDHRPSAKLLQLLGHHQQHLDAVHAQPNGMELGGQDGLLVGRLVHTLSDLELLSSTGAQGPDLRRA